MIRRFLVAAFVALGILSMAFVIIKTRSEVLARTSDPWKGNNSMRWVEETSAHNPSLWLADPRDIAEGRETVRPIREPLADPASGSSGVIARWHHEPADITWNTSSTPTENGEQFAERAGRDFAAMLVAFPKR